MTRGVLAIFTDSNPPFLSQGEIAFLSSREFNGDMGPGMSCGKVYGKRLLTEVNDIASLDNLILETLAAFDYDLPDVEMGEGLHYTDIIQTKDLTNPDKRWKVYEEFWESEWNDEKQDYEEFQHYEDNPWVKYFNYTNYAYVKNLTKETLLLEDRDGLSIDLKPGQSIIFHHGSQCLPEKE